MCIDYTSLNKVCPKDEYYMPRICQTVDSTTSCELLSVLDAYLGYHQICLTTDDAEKTSFITPFRIFYYTKMAFGRGGTYQKWVHIILENQIEKNVESYIDDRVVKSKKRGDLLDDLKEMFDNPRKYKMMLNPKKICVWCAIRKTARLYSVVPGDRCEPRRGGSHRKIATT
jgi:hypothetical protein